MEEASVAPGSAYSAHRQDLWLQARAHAGAASPSTAAADATTRATAAAPAPVADGAAKAAPANLVGSTAAAPAKPPPAAAGACGRPSRSAAGRARSVIAHQLHQEALPWAKREAAGAASSHEGAHSEINDDIAAPAARASGPKRAAVAVVATNPGTPATAKAPMQPKPLPLPLTPDVRCAACGKSCDARCGFFARGTGNFTCRGCCIRNLSTHGFYGPPGTRSLEEAGGRECAECGRQDTPRWYPHHTTLGAYECNACNARFNARKSRPRGVAPPLESAARGMAAGVTAAGSAVRPGPMPPAAVNKAATAAPAGKSAAATVASGPLTVGAGRKAAAAVKVGAVKAAVSKAGVAKTASRAQQAAGFPVARKRPPGARSLLDEAGGRECGDCGAHSGDGSSWRPHPDQQGVYVCGSCGGKDAARKRKLGGGGEGGSARKAPKRVPGLVDTAGAQAAAVPSAACCEGGGTKRQRQRRQEQAAGAGSLSGAEAAASSSAVSPTVTPAAKRPAHSQLVQRQDPAAAAPATSWNAVAAAAAACQTSHSDEATAEAEAVRQGAWEAPGSTPRWELPQLSQSRQRSQQVCQQPARGPLPAQSRAPAEQGRAPARATTSVSDAAASAAAASLAGTSTGLSGRSDAAATAPTATMTKSSNATGITATASVLSEWTSPAIDAVRCAFCAGGFVRMETGHFGFFMEGTRAYTCHGCCCINLKRYGFYGPPGARNMTEAGGRACAGCRTTTAQTWVPHKFRMGLYLCTACHCRQGRGTPPEDGRGTAGAAAGDRATAARGPVLVLSPLQQQKRKRRRAREQQPTSKEDEKEEEDGGDGACEGAVDSEFEELVEEAAEGDVEEAAEGDVEEAAEGRLEEAVVGDVEEAALSARRQLLEQQTAFRVQASHALLAASVHASATVSTLLQCAACPWGALLLGAWGWYSYHFPLRPLCMPVWGCASC